MPAGDEPVKQEGGEARMPDAARPTGPLDGKNIILGVTGGIAAYKAAALASRLFQMGARLDVVMTRNATEFVTPLTFQTLVKNQVFVDMWAPIRAWEVEHVAMADRCHLAVIAPATANIIGKVAAGIADDMLSTVIMAINLRCTVLIVPAMNTNMYENPIVQENIKKLARLGYRFVEPEVGRLAEGYEGKGRFPKEDVIVGEILKALAPQV
jgi:phosphopantothenoylcysteine decarboxylase/phosphopantothenate--cysteine ligase